MGITHNFIFEHVHILDCRVLQLGGSLRREANVCPVVDALSNAFKGIQLKGSGNAMGIHHYSVLAIRGLSDGPLARHTTDGADLSVEQIVAGAGSQSRGKRGRT